MVYRDRTNFVMPGTGGFRRRPIWGRALTASVVFGLAAASLVLLPTLPWLGLLTFTLDALVVTWLGATWRPGLDP